MGPSFREACKPTGCSLRRVGHRAAIIVSNEKSRSTLARLSAPTPARKEASKSACAARR